jgi:transposase
LSAEIRFIGGQPNEGTVHMIVIGTDTHKGSHALAAVDDGTGRVCGQRGITADEPGHLAAVKWARGLDDERVWAIEDCRAVSRRFEQALLAVGERVVRVAPHRMGASRRGERQPGKSDQIDAIAIARAVVKDGIDEFPVAYLDEQAMEVRLLSDHRQDLVAERTRMQSRLRWHLVQLSPELEASLKPSVLSHRRELDRVERRLQRLPVTVRGRIARELVSKIQELTADIDELKQQLLELIKAQRPWLLEETGCGALVAAIMIGRTAGAKRFKSDASFALQAGIAPIPCSSGQHRQYRLNRGGDRQLNRALHIVAVTRARVDPETRAFLERKLAEGKTKKGALRCLKRHLARRFHHLLSLPAQTQRHPIPEHQRRDVNPNIHGTTPTRCLA